MDLSSEVVKTWVVQYLSNCIETIFGPWENNRKSVFQYQCDCIYYICSQHLKNPEVWPDLVQYPWYRVLKSCRCADAHMRKHFQSLSNFFFTFELKTGKTVTYFMILAHLKKFYMVSHVFMEFLGHTSVQNFSQKNLSAQKNQLLESVTCYCV